MFMVATDTVLGARQVVGASFVSAASICFYRLLSYVKDERVDYRIEVVLVQDYLVLLNCDKKVGLTLHQHRL